MILISGSKKYTEDIFNIRPVWEKFNHSRLHEIPTTLSKKLFQTSGLFTAEIKADPLWKYCFVAEHAPQSQFTILMDVLRNNTSFNDGILCLAGSGQNFKGYRNRKWVSVKGNIHLSLFLNPDRPVKNFHTGFTILSAVSVVQTLDAIKGLKGKASVKWVNDILINKAKVSGVLTQTQTQGANVTGVFLGIGVNVQTTPKVERDPFVPQVSSLSDHVPCRESNILKILLNNISKNYKLLVKGGYDQILDVYRERSVIMGKEISLYSDPADGEPELIARGKVKRIGENLELYLQGFQDPINRGRIAF